MTDLTPSEQAALANLLKVRMYAANRRLRALPGMLPTPEWRKLLGEAHHAKAQFEAMITASQEGE